MQLCVRLLARSPARSICLSVNPSVSVGLPAGQSLSVSRPSMCSIHPSFVSLLVPSFLHSPITDSFNDLSICSRICRSMSTLPELLSLLVSIILSVICLPGRLTAWLPGRQPAIGRLPCWLPPTRPAIRLGISHQNNCRFPLYIW